MPQSDAEGTEALESRAIPESLDEAVTLYKEAICPPYVERMAYLKKLDRLLAQSISDMVQYPTEGTNAQREYLEFTKSVPAWLGA